MTSDVTHQTSTYPIVRSQKLPEARRRGPLNILAPRRDSGQAPRPDLGHHVLVYKVDGRYVLDNVSLGAADEQVVRASHVSVVDMRRDAPVVVRFDIASADSSTFTVLVTFECTVVDPVRVVREGLADPQAILLTYVKSHHNATQMGLDFTLSQINDARRYVNAQLTAYKTIAPPLIVGFEVHLASVEVHTPQEIADFSQLQRKRKHRHQLETEDLEYRSEFDSNQEHLEHELSWTRQEHEQAKNLQRRRYDEMIASRTQEHDYELELQAQREQLRRGAELGDFNRRQLEEDARRVGGEYVAALHLARIEGRIDSREMADRLLAERQQERIWVQAEADKDRGERQQQRIWVQAEADKDRGERQQTEQVRYQERIRTLELDRSERLAELEAKREDSRSDRNEQLHADARQRDLEVMKLQWQREDEVERAKINRVFQQGRLDANLQLLRDLAARGYFDTLNVDLERLVARLVGNDPAIDADEAAKQLGAEESTASAWAQGDVPVPEDGGTAQATRLTNDHGN